MLKRRLQVCSKINKNIACVLQHAMPASKMVEHVLTQALQCCPHRHERSVDRRESGARHLALHHRPAQQPAPPHQVLQALIAVESGTGAGSNTTGAA